MIHPSHLLGLTSSLQQRIKKGTNAASSFEKLAAQMLCKDTKRKEPALLLLVICDPVTQCCGGIGSASC